MGSGSARTRKPPKRRARDAHGKRESAAKERPASLRIRFGRSGRRWVTIRDPEDVRYLLEKMTASAPAGKSGRPKRRRR